MSRSPVVVSLLLAGILAGTVTGCRSSGPRGDDEKPAAGAAAVDSSAETRRLLEIAKDYSSWSKVDDQARWAPELCSAPLPPKPRKSLSKDEKTHGGKLYYLFASDRRAYVTADAVDSFPAGMAVVKEAWTSVAATDSDRLHATPDGRFRTGERSALFVVYKAPAGAPNTDEGWVYGTVTPDGKTVTSSGRVASCMGCHRDAPHERLFGLAH